MKRRALLFAAVLAWWLAACAPASGDVRTPAPTATPSPDPTPQATAPPPTPEDKAFIPTLTRLTDPGCCADPFWSPDGREVRFIHKPEGAERAGIYGVSVPGGAMRLVSEQVGLFSPDGRYMAYLNSETVTTIRDTLTGRTWPLFNGARQPVFSPHSRRIAWNETVPAAVFSNRRTTVYVSDLDGENRREVARVRGGGIAGWLDDDHLLLVGRDLNSDQPYPDLFALAVTDGARTTLVQNRRIRSVQIAPAGGWVLYTVTFSPEGPSEDGLWVMKADGSRRRRLEVVGSAQWRDATRLLIIPFEPGAGSHRLLQFDATSGEMVALTDAQTFPFRVSAGYWSVSPKGDYVVFLNAQDGALWAFDLPPSLPEMRTPF